MTKNQSKTVPLYLLHAATRERFEHLDRVHAYFKELKEKVRSARILETGHNLTAEAKGGGTRVFIPEEAAGCSLPVVALESEEKA